MAEAPRTDGFQWGMTALPAVSSDGDRYSYTWFEQAWVPKGAKNVDGAKQFIAFLMQEDNVRPYVEGALGRWFPVTKASQASPFWQADRHRKAVWNQFTGGTAPFDFTKNWKFTILNNENVWAKAMNRVVSEKVPVDKAVDELIARIKQVAG